MPTDWTELRKEAEKEIKISSLETLSLILGIKNLYTENGTNEAWKAWMENMILTQY